MTASTRKRRTRRHDTEGLVQTLWNSVRPDARTLRPARAGNPYPDWFNFPEYCSCRNNREMSFAF
jgi:hypothetical protein